MRFMEDITQNVNPDFIPRDYLKPARQVVPYYLASVILVIGSLQLQDWIGKPTTSLLAFILITIATAYLYYRLQEGNDMIMANDFQNLLFASASSLGSVFCFYVKRDGTVVYANDGTRDMFPQFARNENAAIDMILAEGDVSAEDSNKLYSALTRGKKEHLVFSIKTPDGEPVDFILIIEPLKRPSGYFVVHGRPFYTERNAKVKLPGALAQTSPEKVAVLLDVLPVGVLTTNETGIIEYANPMLEQMSKYEPGTMVRDGLSIQSLIYHADGFETGEFELADYQGDILLSCKNQGLNKAKLQYRRYDNEQGKLSGFIGIVSPAD